MSRHDTALFASAFPCNPRPFLTALRDYLAGDDGDIRHDHAKRILYTLVAILRGQLARIDLAGNARFHREDLARMPDRDTPLGVIEAMIRQASHLSTAETRWNWNTDVASLILFAWGDEGTLDMWEEWSRLRDAWQAGQDSLYHAAA